MNPEHPVYVISKGRWGSRQTVRALEAMGVPHRVVVEEQEREAYASVMDPGKLLVLDPAYQAVYDPCCKLEPGQSKGSGPARNFVWDHAVCSGATRHWIMDDNIRGFFRFNRNKRIRVGDGTIFKCMEDFVERYTNVALAGPHYKMFAPNKRLQRHPFIPNSRIFSCILIRNDLPFRWRGRYNEDTDLSLRALKAGWCTVLFRAFLQDKVATLLMKGGNTDELYSPGTLNKSKMLAHLHPDVAEVVWKWGRWHHVVDYRPFARNRLIRRAGAPATGGVDEYGMELVALDRPTRFDEPVRRMEA